MRKLLAAAFVCYLFLAAAPVWAATLTWTNPTSFSDGSPLVAADIASTKVEWAASNAFLSVVGSLSVAGAATTTSSAPDPAAGGTFCFRVSTVAVAAKGGGTSVPSNIACKSKPFPNPNPPTLLDAVIAWIKRVLSYRWA